MATFTITNLTASAIYLRDFYTTLGAAGSTNTALGPAATLTLNSNLSGNAALQGGTVKVGHFPADVAKMPQIQALLAAGSITLAVVPSSDEILSAAAGGVDSVGVLGISEVAAATAANVPVTIRIPIVAVANGSAAVGIAAGALPFKFRVIDAWLNVPTAVASSVVTLWSDAAGARTQLSGNMLGSVVGIVRPTTALASVQITPAALDGLFAKVTGAGPFTGEAFVTIRRES